MKTHSSNKAYELLTAISMMFGRGTTARIIADAAALTPDDHVIDIGCGPGAAVRTAARRASDVVGIDPSPLMLRLARFLPLNHNVTWLEGTAEALPVPDNSATVAWALSSAHHWTDLPTGVAEIHRVLRPGGRVIIGERLSQPGARGHASHGFTRERAQELAELLNRAGFTDVSVDTRRAGHTTILIVRGTKD